MSDLSIDTSPRGKKEHAPEHWRCITIEGQGWQPRVGLSEWLGGRIDTSTLPQDNRHRRGKDLSSCCFRMVPQTPASTHRRSPDYSSSRRWYVASVSKPRSMDFEIVCLGVAMNGLDDLRGR